MGDIVEISQPTVWRRHIKVETNSRGINSSVSIECTSSDISNDEVMAELIDLRKQLSDEIERIEGESTNDDQRRGYMLGVQEANRQY